MKYLFSPFILIFVALFGICAYIVTTTAMLLTLLSVMFLEPLSFFSQFQGGNKAARFFMNLMMRGMNTYSEIEEGSAFEINENNVREI